MQNLFLLTMGGYLHLLKSWDDDIKRNQDLLNSVDDVRNLDDKAFLRFIVQPVAEISRIKQLQAKYQEAKAREQSLPNRVLTAATMAATGIGGMELAMGLAEQKADKDAATDMEAYMATFQCKIGEKGGKTYTGGTMGIEVPGANELATLYQEYVDLAADLKERKEALGMRPGIESEVVMDKATMGLYDDVGNTNRNGTPGNGGNGGIVTSTIDIIPLIASCIVSKKIASGANHIILDVKYGKGAFIKEHPFIMKKRNC